MTSNDIHALTAMPTSSPSGSPSASRSNSISNAQPAPVVFDAATASTMKAMYAQLQTLAAQNQSLQQQVQQLSSAGSSSYPPSLLSAPPHQAHVKLNPNKPPVFNGKTTLSHWTGAVGRWLTACGITDGAQQVAQVCTFLDPSLGSWWDSVKDEVSNWKDMKEKMEERWQPATLSKLARSRLDSLRQRSTVVDYHNEFLSIVVHIDNMTEEEKLHAFTRGLHPRLREKLETGDKEYTTLQEAVNAATLTEDRRRQFMQTQFPAHRFTFQRNTPFTPSAAASSNSTSTPMEISHITSSDSDCNELWSDSVATPTAAAAAAPTSAPVNVEATAVIKQLLNAMQGHSFGRPKHAPNKNRGGRPLTKLTAEEREKCMREGRCFRCRETGHMSNKCPNANKTTPTPQKNE